MNADEIRRYKKLLTSSMGKLPRTKSAQHIKLKQEGYTTYKDMNLLISKLKRYILGNVLEIMIAKTMIEADDIIPDLSKSSIGEALKNNMPGGKSQVEWVGGYGMTKEGQKSTRLQT